MSVLLIFEKFTGVTYLDFQVWYYLRDCDFAGHKLCFWGALGCCLLMLVGNLSKSWVTEGPNYAFMACHTKAKIRV